MAALGPRLMPAAPAGPGEDMLLRGGLGPDQAREETADLGDSEREQKDIRLLHAAPFSPVSSATLACRRVTTR